MKNPKLELRPFRWRSLAYTIAAAPAFLFAQESDSDSSSDVYMLSPFEVSSDSDQGYRATQSLAGGRINSKIEDLGTSIQSVTKEFLEDVSATGTEELLVYTTNTETAGPNGNFTGTDSSGVQNDGSIRANPAGANRIRGLAAPTRTRGFFESDIPVDTYIAGRMDIQRGANSFLFGLGSPGGIINYDISQAQFSNFGEIGFRLSTEENKNNFSHRLHFNVNRELVEDRFAVRVAGLEEHHEYLQRPAEKDTTRFYAAMNWRLFEGSETFLKVNIEDGEIDAVPPSALGPLENLSTFLNNPAGVNYGGSANRFIGDPYGNVVNLNTTYQGFDGDGNPISLSTGATGNSVISNRLWAMVFDGNSGDEFPVRAFQSGITNNQWEQGNATFDPDNNHTADKTIFFLGMPNLSDIGGDYVGFTQQGLTDLSTYDFRRNLISGTLDTYENSFDALNASLSTMTKDGNFGVELAYDSQSWNHDSFISIGAPTLMFDVNKTLPVGPNSLFGATNPNYGRPFIVSKASGTTDQTTDRDTFRATGFAQYDFADHFGEGLGSWLGNHRATVLYDDSERYLNEVSRRTFNFGNDAGVHLMQANATQFQRQSAGIIYVGPAQLDAFTDPSFSMADWQIDGSGKANFHLPEGYEIPIAYFDMNTQETAVGSYSPRFAPATAQIDETKIESQALNLQSFFLKDHLVANLGWREDKWQNRLAAPPLGDENVPNIDPSVFNLNDAEVSEVRENNFSYNLVLKAPQKWLPDGMRFSVHYSDSSNFVPNLIGSDIHGNAVPNSSGDSQDWGFTVSAFDEKIITRVNFYETKIQNEIFTPVDFGFKWTTNVSQMRGYGNLLVEADRYDANGDGVFDDPTLDTNNNGLIDSLEGNGNTYMTLGQLNELKDAYAALMTPYLTETAPFGFIPKTEGQTQGRYTLGNKTWFTLADTADVVGEGLEIETIYNPTRNFRMAFSLVQQKASRTNLAPNFTGVFNGLRETLESVPNAKGSIFGANKLRTPQRDPLAGGTGWNQLILGNWAGKQFFPNTALDGADNPEVREWRANVVGNYSFFEGAMKGVKIGGAYRYLDSASIGYGNKSLPGDIVIPDVNLPIVDSETDFVDLWVGRSKKIMNDRVDWRIQFNIRNVLSDGGVEMVRAQPDGSPARVRVTPPRAFLLTNNFGF